MGIGRGVGIGLKSHRGPLEVTFAPLLLNFPAVCSTLLFGFVFLNDFIHSYTQNSIVDAVVYTSNK